MLPKSEKSRTYLPVRVLHGAGLHGPLVVPVGIQSGEGNGQPADGRDALGHGPQDTADEAAHLAGRLGPPPVPALVPALRPVGREALGLLVRRHVAGQQQPKHRLGTGRAAAAGQQGEELRDGEAAVLYLSFERKLFRMINVVWLKIMGEKQGLSVHDRAGKNLRFLFE